MSQALSHRESQKAYRKSLKQRGICVDCRRDPVREGGSLCMNCAEARRKRYYAKKAASDKFIEENGTVVERKMEIAERLYRLRRMAAVFILIACSCFVNAQSLQKRETVLRPVDTCSDEINRERDAFLEASKRTHHSETAAELLSLYNQAGDPKEQRWLCIDGASMKAFKLRIAIAKYLLANGDAQ